MASWLPEEFRSKVLAASRIEIVVDNARRPKFSYTESVDPVQLVHFGSSWMKFTSCPSKEKKRLQLQTQTGTRWGNMPNSTDNKRFRRVTSDSSMLAGAAPRQPHRGGVPRVPERRSSASEDGSDDGMGNATWDAVMALQQPGNMSSLLSRLHPTSLTGGLLPLHEEEMTRRRENAFLRQSASESVLAARHAAPKIPRRGKAFATQGSTRSFGSCTTQSSGLSSNSSFCAPSGGGGSDGSNSMWDLTSVSSNHTDSSSLSGTNKSSNNPLLNKLNLTLSANKVPSVSVRKAPDRLGKSIVMHNDSFLLNRPSSPPRSNNTGKPTGEGLRMPKRRSSTGMSPAGASEIDRPPAPPLSGFLSAKLDRFQTAADSIAQSNIHPATRQQPGTPTAQAPKFRRASSERTFDVQSTPRASQRVSCTNVSPMSSNSPPCGGLRLPVRRSSVEDGSQSSPQKSGSIKTDGYLHAIVAEKSKTNLTSSSDRRGSASHSSRMSDSPSTNKSPGKPILTAHDSHDSSISGVTLPVSLRNEPMRRRGSALHSTSDKKSTSPQIPSRKPAATSKNRDAACTYQSQESSLSGATFPSVIPEPIMKRRKSASHSSRTADSTSTSTHSSTRRSLVVSRAFASATTMSEESCLSGMTFPHSLDVDAYVDNGSLEPHHEHAMHSPDNSMRSPIQHHNHGNSLIRITESPDIELKKPVRKPSSDGMPSILESPLSATKQNHRKGRRSPKSSKSPSSGSSSRSRGKVGTTIFSIDHPALELSTRSEDPTRLESERSPDQLRTRATRKLEHSRKRGGSVRHIRKSGIKVKAESQTSNSGRRGQRRDEGLHRMSSMPNIMKRSERLSRTTVRTGTPKVRPKLSRGTSEPSIEDNRNRKPRSPGKKRMSRPKLPRGSSVPALESTRSPKKKLGSGKRSPIKDRRNGMARVSSLSMLGVDSVDKSLVKDLGQQRGVRRNPSNDSMTPSECTDATAPLTPSTLDTPTKAQENPVESASSSVKKKKNHLKMVASSLGLGKLRSRLIKKKSVKGKTLATVSESESHTGVTAVVLPQKEHSLPDPHTPATPSVIQRKNISVPQTPATPMAPILMSETPNEQKVYARFARRHSIGTPRASSPVISEPRKRRSSMDHVAKRRGSANMIDMVDEAELQRRQHSIHLLGKTVKNRRKEDRTVLLNKIDGHSVVKKKTFSRRNSLNGSSSQRSMKSSPVSPGRQSAQFQGSPLPLPEMNIPLRC